MVANILQGQSEGLKKNYLTWHLLIDKATMQWRMIISQKTKSVKVDKKTIIAMDKVSYVYAKSYIMESIRWRDEKQKHSQEAMRKNNNTIGQIKERLFDIQEKIRSWRIGNEKQSTNKLTGTRGLVKENNTERELWECVIDLENKLDKIVIRYNSTKDIIWRIWQISWEIGESCLVLPRWCIQQRRQVLEPIEQFRNEILIAMRNDAAWLDYLRWQLVNLWDVSEESQELLSKICRMNELWENEYWWNKAVDVTHQWDLTDEWDATDKENGLSDHEVTWLWNDLTQNIVDALEQINALHDKTNQLWNLPWDKWGWNKISPTWSTLPNIFERKLQEIRKQQEIYYAELRHERIQNVYDPIQIIDQYFGEFFGDTQAITY
jgi:hypothetical protein